MLGLRSADCLMTEQSESSSWSAHDLACCSVRQGRNALNDAAALHIAWCSPVNAWICDILALLYWAALEVKSFKEHRQGKPGASLVGCIIVISKALPCKAPQRNVCKHLNADGQHGVLPVQHSKLLSDAPRVSKQ